MENQNLIKYKWESGIYNIKDMINLVKDNVLTKEKFFEITRFSYDGIIKSHNKKGVIKGYGNK